MHFIEQYQPSISYQSLFRNWVNKTKIKTFLNYKHAKSIQFYFIDSTYIESYLATTTNILFYLLCGGLSAETTYSVLQAGVLPFVI